jgi:hypothetical protein
MAAQACGRESGNCRHGACIGTAAGSKSRAGCTSMQPRASQRLARRFHCAWHVHHACAVEGGARWPACTLAWIDGRPVARASGGGSAAADGCSDCGWFQTWAKLTNQRCDASDVRRRHRRAADPGPTRANRKLRHGALTRRNDRLVVARQCAATSCGRCVVRSVLASCDDFNT